MTLIKLKQNGKAGYPSAQGKFLPMFDEMFNDIFGGSAQFTKSPAVNIKEDEKNYFLEFAVPGFEKDEFKISLENQVLTVSGAKKNETKEDGKEYTRREFMYSSFQRSFNLPETANEEAIKAEYKNGILHVAIPKKEEENKQKKEITIE